MQGKLVNGSIADGVELITTPDCVQRAEFVKGPGAEPEQLKITSVRCCTKRKFC